MSGNMDKDVFYAEMLALMRILGGKDNPTTLQLGVMQSSNSVKIDDLTLYAEDIYIADYLVAGYEMPLVTPYVDSVTVGHYDGTYTTQSKAVKASGLSKGDLVAIQKLHNTNKYVILAKVVSVK